MTDTQTPEVTARVEENWAALEVDGETQTIRADTEEEVRHEVLRRTVQIAAAAQTDVHLIATDRDGEWRLIVTPDGQISETGIVNQSHGTHQGGGSETDAVPVALDQIAAPPNAGLDVVDDATPTELRPYYDFSGPSDEEEIEQTTLREPGSTTTDGAAADSVSTDTVFADTVFADTVRRDSLPRPASDETSASSTVIGDPPSAVPEPQTAPAQDTAGADAGPVTIAATGEQIADAPAEPRHPTPSPQAAPVPSPQHAPVPPSTAGADSSVPDAATATVAGAPAASAPPLAASAAPAPLPTLADFQATQPPPVAGPAAQGWRGAIRRGSGGLISLKPSSSEQRHREAVASVTRSLSGPRTICVINPKGGAHKTTATMLVAATFGMYRGGYTLAWDNNETRGTLGWRAHQARHTNTAVNLLNDIDRFTDLRSARVGDLDNYVRSQADAQFDVLASDEDAAASSMIDDEGFRRLHETLQRFYRIIVVDTGNNMRASNWEAAIAAADQLVIVSAIREDTAGGAAWMVEGLARKGHEDKLRDAVTILSAPDKNTDARLRSRLLGHFGSLTRDVVEVPYDPALVSGAGISINTLAPATREAWLTATATIANGL